MTENYYFRWEMVLPILKILLDALMKLYSKTPVFDEKYSIPLPVYKNHVDLIVVREKKTKKYIYFWI